ncbi:hypothetical protein B0A48_00417 [Cryoendolithus antarcticus]|uniref:DUF2231 domain-containing protein n=1 Tax=Cryoendolithus antarcticus TaxID=1507870 RepID=A0A1V8TUF9_9PEZI|nr:hypothetical protein B0A48_00417 [Cryoendolithus antarcticus]OQO19717.1 hypothetical protein B0A51_12777 [Rachicladosporium sp. CCFEE 5018]
MSGPGKPIHPATVHFPISFLALSYGLDAAYFARPNLPSALTSLLPIDSDLTRASYYLLSLGLITMLPSIASGGQQALVMFQRQGIYEADGKTVRVKSKAVIAHAIVNDVVLALGTWIWWTKRSAAADSLASSVAGEKLGAALTGAAAYAPSNVQVLVGVLTLGLLFFGASIGGSLTYLYGVGFAPGGKSKPSEKAL